ncbi:sodium-dependent transporter [Treponema sp. Marseille-Q3903]|uniref:sodium-dependent transporter n=1 Tax=Treponema sp. Marseille-Q3903 TaxID=2766703 RepID=UPI0016521C6C|nr:sodium-dependent transporter [Treponema sp. Marseille-Q3903]MBC6712647.1 sodium-dependent transporter [Treponema sp. Marseille-Q3903]
MRSKFSSRLGYVLATAGSAVGLGNIWRFPYLSAKYGGGIFLLVYILLALTFGYTMIISETALGRIARKSPVGAFKHFRNSKLSLAGGWINAIIPMLIVPYYSVIGGWVCKYLFEYVTFNREKAALDGFFTSFISNPVSTEIWFLVFAIISLTIVFTGVRHGVEAVSKVMMPILVILAVVIAIFSMTRKGAADGIKYFLVPNLSNFSWMTVVAAMGQMFYSLSIAMGILITYGSYMHSDVDIEKSTFQVAAFDTGIAVLSGLMIIPAVFAFSGNDPAALKAGPSLMFISIPKIFAEMAGGNIIGIMFFILVFFAAMTSSIALLETAISTFEDELGWSRHKATIMMSLIMVVLGSVNSLGFSSLSFVKIFKMDILDFFDFTTNSIMMPIAAMATCLLVLKRVGTKEIEKEIMKSSSFAGKALYKFCIRFIAPIFILVILISSILNVLGIINL